MTNLVPLLSVLTLSWLLTNIAMASNPDQTPKHYIVYMGASDPLLNENEIDDEAAESAYVQLLSSTINLSDESDSERASIIHSYSHSFRGFSAMLTDHEASILSDHNEVVSVFPDTMLQLHTTRSWDFIEGKAGRLSNSRLSSDKYSSSDIIIGIIDTGIWPESPSFNDDGIGPIPSRWKGACMEGFDFKKYHCNRKLIGARFYNDKGRGNKATDSPRDTLGHGTHTASTAGGSRVPNASYYGLARGTARGGFPSARIASYKVCTSEGCSGSAILKAIDDATKDGVDIISISIGMSSLFQSDYLDDPVAIGAFHAEQKGVMVICSAGNDGPGVSTVVNTAPWMLTVAASSIDRDFKATVLLGNGKALKGISISLPNPSSSKVYPLAFGKDVAANSTVVSEARNCVPESLDAKKVAGKIVICTHDDTSVRLGRKRRALKDGKAKGWILIDEAESGNPYDSKFFSFVGLGKSAGSEILHYVKSTKKPTASIFPTVEVRKHRPAPVVAYFSSRGPGQLTENILKPDIMAPGVAILAGVVPKSDESLPTGVKPSGYALKSGTSMSCPHVAGAAAFIKSVRRGWTSSIIRSALMTTATVFNNMKNPVTNSSTALANPHEAGAGEINPFKALNPGLVFETTTEDYLEFLCFYGYPKKNITSLSRTKFSCPKHSSEDLISNMNYPSISIGKIHRDQPAKVIQRTVTNVGPSSSTYVAKVDSPPGLVVKVTPKKMSFTEDKKRLSFKVSFNCEKARKGYNFGSVTWFDGRRSARVVFSVNVV